MKDRVCMILDFDGYWVKKHFIVREMGWCDREGYATSLHFQPSFKYYQLPAKEKRQVDYVYKHVHALPFDAHPPELASPCRIVLQVVKQLYSLNRRHRLDVIAYKGGNLERGLLKKLNIPSLNLEEYGCPKASQLPDMGFDPGMSCGCHDMDIGHCPRQETFLFHQWMTKTKFIVK